MLRHTHTHFFNNNNNQKEFSFKYKCNVLRNHKSFLEILRVIRIYGFSFKIDLKGIKHKKNVFVLNVSMLPMGNFSPFILN